MQHILDRDTAKAYLQEMHFPKLSEPYRKNLLQRNLMLTVSMAAYGKPDSAILVFEGTPPQLPVYVTFYFPEHMTICINGQWLKPDSAKFAKARRSIVAVLVSAGVLQKQTN